MEATTNFDTQPFICQWPMSLVAFSYRNKNKSTRKDVHVVETGLSSHVLGFPSIKRSTLFPQKRNVFVTN